MAKTTKGKAPKRVRRNIAQGKAYISASYNNTIVTIADPEGNPLSWSSGGTIGMNDVSDNRKVCISVRSASPSNN